VPPRKSLRLSHYDYAMPGAYFVTACTHERTCLLGKISDGTVRLSEAGRVVAQVWQDLPAHYPNFSLDEFVIMPNHLHGLLVIEREGGRPLSNLMRAFKAFSTREIKAQRLVTDPVWQRGYYEHVVRDEADLAVICQYIQDNPAKWDLDDENPARRR
jgi:REP element-mobilizing transposase RayT